MEAAGASSAWSQTFNHPPRDRADGATLGSLPPEGDSEGRGSGTHVLSAIAKINDASRRSDLRLWVWDEPN